MIKEDGLTKHFGEFDAIDHISLSVESTAIVEGFY